MTLSVCFIVKDEEETIARALACAASFADEIVVVDTGSSDKTLSIASEFTDKIYHFDWIDDFSAARNYAFERAFGDFLMWMDADDVVDSDSAKKIRSLVDGGDFDLAYLRYIWGGVKGAPAFSYLRERIFRRSMNFRFSGFVHEAVAPRGKTVVSDACIEHKKVKSPDPARNLNIYRRAISRGVKLDARSLFYYGRELMYNRLYIESAAVLEEFLSGDGWVENKIEACMNLCAVYEMLGQKERAISCVLRSFMLDSPRAEACCRLAGYHMENGRDDAAIYWYKRALACGGELERGSFVCADYFSYIPNMQLCVLYDRRGDYANARAFNEAAGRQKPNDASYLHNRQYFQKKLSKEVKNE